MKMPKSPVDDSESIDDSQAAPLSDSDDITPTEETESPVDSLYEMFSELTPEEQQEFLSRCKSAGHSDKAEKVTGANGLKTPYKGPKSFSPLGKL